MWYINTNTCISKRYMIYTSYYGICQFGPKLPVKQHEHQAPYFLRLQPFKIYRHCSVSFRCTPHALRVTTKILTFWGAFSRESLKKPSIWSPLATLTTLTVWGGGTSKSLFCLLLQSFDLGEFISFTIFFAVSYVSVCSFTSTKINRRKTPENPAP